MVQFPILRELGLVVLGAAAAFALARPLRVPPLVAFIVAGIVLGPVAGLLHIDEALHLLSELGVALLLFLVGLELDLERIRALGRPALIGGTVQVLLSAAAGFPIAAAFGFGTTEAILIALALAFSSTVVVIKLLDAKRELSALHGRMAIGILLVQDVAVAIALTLVPAMAGDAAGGLGASIVIALGGLLLLGTVAAVGGRLVLPGLTRWLATGAPETLTVFAVTWCFLFILAAGVLGVSIELGAFIAGVALAQLAYGEELRRRVHPLVSFFLAVFFVSLGAELDPALALERPGLVLALAGFAIVGKAAITAGTVRLLGFPLITAVRTGITLGQISEFSLILMASGAAAGLVGEETMAVVGAAALLTIAVSSALILGDRRVTRVLRLGEPPPEAATLAGDAGHIVVVGMNALGRRLVRAFADRGERVVAVDTDPTKLEPLGVRTLLGTVDHRAVLESAGVARAALVVSALQIEDTNLLLAFRCHRMGVPSGIHAFDASLVDDLKSLGADYLMVSKHDGIRQVAEALRQEGQLD